MTKVKVFPEAKEIEIKKKGEDEFLVKVKEKAERGEANRGVIGILADYFNLSENKVKLIKGSKRKNKIFKIYD